MMRYLTGVMVLGLALMAGSALAAEELWVISSDDEFSYFIDSDGVVTKPDGVLNATIYQIYFDLQDVGGSAPLRAIALDIDFDCIASISQQLAGHGLDDLMSQVSTLYAKDPEPIRLGTNLAFAASFVCGGEDQWSIFAQKMSGDASLAEAVRISRTLPLAQPQQVQQPVQPPIAAPAVTNISIAMVMEGGVFTVPVLINGNLTLHFIVDSGASDVSVPSDVVSTLMRTGTITDSDFTGVQRYVIADGSTVTARTFVLRSLRVGDITLQNVEASVSDSSADLLLGQSFLGRFNSWSIDNSTHTLVLE